MLEFITETSRVAPYWSVRNSVGDLVGHVYREQGNYVFSATSITERFDSHKLDEISNFLESFGDKSVDTAPPA